MHYDIFASAEDDGPPEWVERYTTREGSLAKARVLLNQGRGVEIRMVREDAPKPGDEFRLTAA